MSRLPGLCARVPSRSIITSSLLTGRPVLYRHAVTLVGILLGALILSGVLLAARWVNTVSRGNVVPSSGAPNALQLAIGFVTNFFDTLGIGSFAPTTAIFRLMRLVPDELIPGTLLVGHALPVVTQALFFVSAVSVDPLQMMLLIVLGVAGGWLGAGIVASLSRRAVQLAWAVRCSSPRLSWSSACSDAFLRAALHSRSSRRRS